MTKTQKRKVELMSDMIDVREAAKMLGVSGSMMRVYVRAGCIKSKKVRGTRWEVSKQEIQDIVDGKTKVDFAGAWGKVHGKKD